MKPLIEKATYSKSWKCWQSFLSATKRIEAGKKLTIPLLLVPLFPYCRPILSRLNRTDLKYDHFINSEFSHNTVSWLCILILQCVWKWLSDNFNFSVLRNMTKMLLDTIISFYFIEIIYYKLNALSERWCWKFRVLNVVFLM